MMTLEKVEYEQVSFIEGTGMDHPTMNKNFADIGKDLTALIKELEAVKLTSGLINLSVLCEAEGTVIVLPGRIHPTVILRSGYIVAGDNIKETVKAKVLYGNKEQRLAEGTIKSTEKAGKAQNLSIKKREIVNRMDDVMVQTDNRRKVIINLVFEVSE